MNRSHVAGAFVLLCAFIGDIYAQSLPATDLWLVKMENGIPGDPEMINQGVGYHNQPRFSDDGSIIFYTCEVSGEDSIAQTDIAAFDIGKGTTTKVTSTRESEYSPTPVPGRNALSVIQVEANQKQRLWAIDIDSGEMELLFPDVEPVGYHDWFSDNDVAMFILGDSFDLYTASLGTEGSRLIASNIGRSIRRHPQSNEILFVDKNHTPWQIAAFDAATGGLRTVMPLFPENEDFTVDSNGDYWTGNGSKLYRHSPGDRGWKLIADFRDFGVNNISRLATHLDSGQISFVSERIASQ